MEYMGNIKTALDYYSVVVLPKIKGRDWKGKEVYANVGLELENLVSPLESDVEFITDVRLKEYMSSLVKSLMVLKTTCLINNGLGAREARNRVKQKMDLFEGIIRESTRDK